MRTLNAFFMVCALSMLTPMAVAEDSPVTQDGLGLLHGTFTRVTKASEERDLPALGYVGEFLVTPDGQKVACHCWSVDEKHQVLDRVVIMDVATAKVEQSLDEDKNGIAERMPMHFTADGKTLLMGYNNGIDAYDLKSGLVVKEYHAPKDRSLVGYSYSEDATKVVAMTEDGGALVWDLIGDKTTYVKLDLPKESSRIAFLLGGGDDFLVVNRPSGEGAKTRITIVDPKSMKVTLLKESLANVVVRPTSDGKRAYIFVAEDPQKEVCTSIEEWDLRTAKLTKKEPLQPPLASINLKLSSDGETLFLHEYLARPVIMWNLKQGKFVASVGPNLGGCQAFDMTPDGKKVIAFVGPWIEGTLVPKKLAVYDTSALVVGTK